MTTPVNPRREFPPWLKKRWPAGRGSAASATESLALNTVCRSAECPNLGECRAHGTATFMILGRVCTRNCRYCAVESGRGTPLSELADEPERVAEAVRRMGLRYVVITSVTRDDLPDGGAAHFARTIRAIHTANPGVSAEILIPDFNGQKESLRLVLEAGVAVLNHNVECVERLFSAIRPQGDYRRSLAVLRQAKELRPELTTKSGLMVGLGEKRGEVVQTLRDLREVGCELATIGQYLSPASASSRFPVPTEFVPPARFEEYRTEALRLGFRAAACGPFVRSSYRAAALHAAAMLVETHAVRRPT